MQIGINPLFNEVLNSQCSLGQLYNGHVKLFGIALHSPESNIARALLEKKLVDKGAIPLLNHDRLMLIKDGNHYFDFSMRTLSGSLSRHLPKNLMAQY